MRSLALSLLVLTLAPRSLRADAIWDRRVPRAAYLFVDNRARRVGDLLTIVVRETTDIDNRDKRQLDKKTETGGIFKFKGKSVDTVTSRAASADLDSSTTSKRKLDGKAEFTSERELLDRMTVRVIDVLPNGNLLIAGKRRRVVAGEDRTLHLTGLVRPDDIGPGNIVQSQFIGDLQVAYEGRGAESQFLNHGWLGRIVNEVWPF